MEARFKRVRQLFAKPGAKFRVPEYQRGYEWDEKNFQDLWADLERVGGNIEMHYLGNIILLEKNGGGGKSFDIVDGQQRMVTISLLIMAIRDAQGIDNKDDRILEDILNTYPTKDAERKLLLYDDDQDAEFEKLWRGETDDLDGTVGEAYEFYRKKVAEFTSEEIEELKTDVVDRLRVVETTSSDDSLAYMVFQSQNERGKDVEPQILAKARIFGEADNLTDRADQREVKGRWQAMYRQLERELSTPRFRDEFRVRRPLSQILVTSDTPTPSRIDKSALYREFDESLQNHSDVLEFVEWFDDQVENYLQISSNRYEITGRDIPLDAQRHLQYFNAVSTHAEVLSLSIKNRVANDTKLTEFFRLASILGMRLELGGRRSEYKREAVYTTARDVRREDDLRETLKQAIKDKTPTDAEIREHLKANDMTTRGQWAFRTVLILSSLEEDRRGPLRIDFDDLHLEHIAPRNIFENGRYATWQREIGVDGNDFEEFVDKLGNLTLLSPSDHSRLDETSFEKKEKSLSRI
jgi:hypothetical protein